MLLIETLASISWAPPPRFAGHRSRLGLWLVASLILLAFVVACRFEDTVDSGSPAIGETAPGFEVDMLNGDAVTLSELRGRPVVLNFWATTCAPCRRELPTLERVASEHVDDGLQVLAVNTGESAAAIDGFLSELSIELPVAIDKNGELVALYEVMVLPMTYFIDRDGVLRYRSVGEPKQKQLDYGLDEILRTKS